MSEAERNEQVVLLACNIDDMTGEELGHALELLLRAGALDAWHTPIVMKKSRPAVVFSVLSRVEDAARLREALLIHTSTLGVRWQELERMACERRVVEVATSWGPIRCKLKLLHGRVLAAKAEYDDCALAAQHHGVTLREVAREAERLALLSQ